MGFRLLTRALLLVSFSFLSEGVWGRNVDLMRRQGITVSGSVLSPSSSGTSTSSAATITPSPIFTFNNISALTTCTSTSISWFYLGPKTPMTLTVANIDVTQSSSSSRSATSTVSSGARVPATINIKIASALDPTSLDYTWPSVNVPEGWYVMYAGIPAYYIVESSTAFFVTTGSDTSCIVTSASTSASHSSSRSLASSLSAPTAVPVSASSSSSINKGAIIGIVIGSIAVCFILIVAYCCRRRGKGGRPIKGIKGGTWAGLKSTDSHTGLGRISRSQPQSQEDSLGPVAPMGSDEGTIPSEEKFSTSPAKYPGNGSPYDYETGLSLATLPTLQHSQGLEPTGGARVSRSYSQASSHGGHSVNAMEFGSPPIAYLQNRRPSTTESHKPLFDSPSYPPPISTGGQLNRSTSTRSATQPPTSNHQQEPPTSPVASPETKKANRGSLKRKPVPAYEDHELSSSSPVSSPPAAAFPDLRSNGSDASLRAPAFLPDLRSNGSNASLRGFGAGNGGGSSNGGHYTTRARTRSRPGSAHSLAVPQELAHKGSFGPGGVEGKPMHYLIPDMPMKQ